MPSSKNYVRNYQQEASNETPARKKQRAMRNQARRVMERAGRVSKGDGKDVDHKKALSKGGSNGKSNLRVVSASTNRSYKRKKDGSMK